MFAYATVLKTDSQLADAVVLAYSLRRHGSQYPLVVLCGKAVSSEAFSSLNEAAGSLNVHIKRISSDSDSGGGSELPLGTSISNGEAATLKATSTVSEEEEEAFSQEEQLCIFAPCLWSYEMVCFIAVGSVLVGSGMDLVFTEAQLPTDDWLAATSLCSCSRGKGPATEPYSPIFSFAEHACPLSNTSPGVRRALSFSVSSPIEMEPPVTAAFESRLLVFYPSERLWDKINRFLARSPRDHIHFDEVLNEAFRSRWMSLPWQYFGSESIRIRHRGLWDQERAICVYPDRQVRSGNNNDQVEDKDGKLPELWKTVLDSWQEEANGNEKLSNLLHILRTQTVDEGGGGRNTEDDGSGGDRSKPGSHQSGTTSELRTDYSQIYANKGSAERGHGPVVHSS
jgi:inositol 3-alpha-galactosyltransferase